MTPEQYRMACAALRLSFLDVGEEVGLSRSDLADFSRDKEHAISDEGLAKLESWFNSRQVFFGPRHGVCLGQDVFAAERKQSLALFQLLNEAGITPSSADLIAAGRRAAAPAAEAAELRGLLTELVGQMMGDDDGAGNAHCHCHSTPGIWDSDNPPDKAGTPCAWCALWAKALKAAGVKPRKPKKKRLSKADRDFAYLLQQQADMYQRQAGMYQRLALPQENSAPVTAIIGTGQIIPDTLLLAQPLCSDIEPGKP